MVILCDSYICISVIHLQQLFLQLLTLIFVFFLEDILFLDFKM